MKAYMWSALADVGAVSLSVSRKERKVAQRPRVSYETTPFPVTMASSCITLFHVDHKFASGFAF
jgi:hypothetical protein